MTEVQVKILCIVKKFNMKKYSLYIVTIVVLLAALISVCFIPISASKLIPLVEEQVESDLGAKIHIEKLILRVGPYIKLKTPVMHLMYSDGQKFAQLDNVKFYISWRTFLKKSPVISKMYASKLLVRISSEDKNSTSLLESLKNKDINDLPKVYLKEYSLTYKNQSNGNKYSLNGSPLSLEKVANYNNFKLNTKTSFYINDKKYISADLTILPKLNLPQELPNYDIETFINQIIELDFHSDLIADLKLYKSQDDAIQASGFINIDNISVLDFSKKNPKSFIYLTLWGDKASILSNIYTSQTQKVYIEGMVNNSKKPVLDLKVKTDKIAINDLFKKVKIITDLSFLKGINNVSGTLEANFNIKGDLNKIKSSGFMKIEKANLITNGLKVNNINADIDFSNNIINIQKAVGYVNNSPITAKGKIDKNIDLQLLMNNIELKHLCPEQLGVKKGTASLISTISGSLSNITHKENLQIDNLKIVNNTNEFELESLRLDTNKNNTAYVKNIICKTKDTDNIKIPTLKFIIDDNAIKILDTNIFMPNSKLTVKGEVSNYLNNNLSYNANISGFVNSKDFKCLKSYSGIYPILFILNGNKYVQNINGQIFLEKPNVLDEPTILNISSKLEKNMLKFEDLSLLSIVGNFSNDLKLNLKGTKKLVITGTVENLKSPVLKNIRVFIPQILNLTLADTNLQLKGDIFLNGKFDKPDIVGQIMLQNFINQTTQLGITNAAIDFNKNIFNINAPQIKLADTTFSLNSQITNNFSKGINVKTVNIRSKYLNTDTLLMYKDMPVLNAYPLTIHDGKFYSERVQANVYGSPLYLTAFSADFRLNNNILRMKNIASELFNGKLAGSIDYNLRDEHFDANIMARTVSAAPIFDIISTRKDTISGTMSFDTIIKGELTSKQSLNGNIKFVVNNGRMSTLGKLEHLLYAQNVVADSMLRTSLSVVTKAITLKDTGLFKYLRGDIELKQGLAYVNMLQSQGPLMALFMKGVYNPINDHASLVVLGRLSDEIISGLGAFGDFSLNKLMVMLTGEENKTSIQAQDLEKLPQLPMKNTKEFRTIINGVIDKPSSVILFNWISYSQKSLRQKEVPITETELPSFVQDLPY